MSSYNCPKCNSAFTIGTKFCQSCGYNLENDFIENPVCPTCGKNFTTGTRFCDIDGTKLVDQKNALPRCVKCGTEYAIGTQFCPKDGAAVIAGGSTVNNGNQQSSNWQSPINPNWPTGYYPKASLGDRFLASLIDGLVLLALAIPSIILIILGAIELDKYYDEQTKGYIYIGLGILLFVLPLIYNFIKDGLGNGQSYGKRAMSLMVVNLDNNTPCNMGKSAVRYLIMLLLGIIPYVGGLIEPIMVLADKDGRRLGDRAANTQVIEVRHYKKSENEKASY
ncbi:RDD family protein [Oscillatoria amoena NRMC-F 0135]|nr:RDD family protein [Oscillatoria amoena NRMC-F 0135]